MSRRRWASSSRSSRPAASKRAKRASTSRCWPVSTEMMFIAATYPRPGQRTHVEGGAAQVSGAAPGFNDASLDVLDDHVAGAHEHVAGGADLDLAQENAPGGGCRVGGDR